MAKPYDNNSYVIVEAGDNLWNIAKQFLGDPMKYKQIASIPENNIKNPDLIYVGQKIWLTKPTGSSSSKPAAKDPNITQFGVLSTDADTIFATWTWSKYKDNTESYKVLWTYDTGNGVWLGSPTSISVDEDAPEQALVSTFNIPDNARKVRFKVKPIAKTKPNSNNTRYWSAEWSEQKTWTDETPLATPGTPSVELEKYKLTATLDGIEIDGATHIEFEVVKDNKTTVFTQKANITTGHASYVFTVDAGGEYKVRARAYRSSDKSYSDYSQYSNNYESGPAPTKGIKLIKATSDKAVYMEWDAVASAAKYDIEYTAKLQYFDGSDQTTIISGIEGTHYEKVGLESGQEYFFRIRSVNKKGEVSAWSEAVSIVIGKAPAAPTTWSSTTTAMVGEPLMLYWVHNTKDNSSQTFAELELIIDGVKETYTIKNTTDEEEKDKTSYYEIDTNRYADGSKIIWRVRTAGVTNVYGEWSIQRTIDIYAPANLEMRMTDLDGNSIGTLTTFPFYIYALAGPKNQAPTGYHLTVTSNEIYETTDRVGNQTTVNAGDQVYSKYFDISEELLVEFSAGNIDLENNVNYTVTCTVSMNSGLTAETSLDFDVSWSGIQHRPNAEIGVDTDTYTAYIMPYCNHTREVYYKVRLTNGVYTKTSETFDYMYGEIVRRAKTTTGEQVYSGMTVDGEEVYFCTATETTPITDVFLAVYRREFDGSFTEIESGLDGARATTVTDPHPALDYARYRIVATSKTTGAVGYYDLPGYPVNGQAVIVQWDEDWSTFETTEDGPLAQPPWSGSMLKLPYNIDVSDSVQPDTAKVEYIGRTHPIVYYGTQIGQTSTWNVAIEKDDEETLYALRRLAKWMGNVYVREPSGSGYWANVTVSFSQKHLDLTIPVTLNIVRVEGGV